MKFDTTSKSLDKVIFSSLDSGLEVAISNAANLGLLHGIDPEDLTTTVAKDTEVSAELERYGSEWYVDSSVVAEAAPRSLSPKR